MIMILTNIALCFRILILAVLTIWTVFISTTLMMPARVYQHPGVAIKCGEGIVKSVTSGSPLSPSFWIHISYFGIQALLVIILFLCMRNKGSAAYRMRIVCGSIVVIIYGLIIELLQELFVAGRALELNDIIANVIGVLSAAIIVGCFMGLKRLGTSRSVFATGFMYS